VHRLPHAGGVLTEAQERVGSATEAARRSVSLAAVEIGQSFATAKANAISAISRIFAEMQARAEAGMQSARLFASTAAPGIEQTMANVKAMAAKARVTSMEILNTVAAEAQQAWAKAKEKATESCGKVMERFALLGLESPLKANAWLTIFVVLAVVVLACTAVAIAGLRRRSAVAADNATKATSELASKAVETAAPAHAGRALDMVPTPSRRRVDSPGAVELVASADTEQRLLETLNAKTMEELLAFRGIGPVSAERIMQHREICGRISSVEDLVSKVKLPKRTVNLLLKEMS